MTRVFWDVDTQVDFMLPDGKLYVPGAEAIAGNLGRLTDFAHANGIRIVASSDNHDPDDAELSYTPDFKDTFPPHCLRGTPGQARIPQTALSNPLLIEPEEKASTLPALLKDHAEDILFHKHWFDVFTNPHVSPVVEALSIADVLLYGVALDVCVSCAVEGLLARHPALALTVVEDAVQGIDENARGAILEGWRERGVAITTTDAVVGGTRT